MYSLHNSAIQTGFLFHSGWIARLEQDQAEKHRKEIGER